MICFDDERLRFLNDVPIGIILLVLLPVAIILILLNNVINMVNHIERKGCR